MAPAATSGESTACVQVPNLFRTVERRKHSQHLTTALIMGKPKLARLFSTRSGSRARYDADYIWAPCENDEPYCENVPTNPATGYAASDSIGHGRGDQDHPRPRRRQRSRAAPRLHLRQLPAGRLGRSRSRVVDRSTTSAAGLADDEIKRFVANQKDLGIWDETVMMIVSDHSMDSTPQLSKVSIEDSLRMGGVPDSAYTVVGNGSAAHVYLNDRTAPDAAATLAKMRSILTGVAGIDEVVYREPNPADGGDRQTIARLHPEWGLGGPRTGDIVVTTMPGIGIRDTSEASSFPFNPLPGNHGSPTTTDNTFLISGGSPMIAQGPQRLAASNVDVNPTAMRLLNRKPARAVQGSFPAQGLQPQVAAEARRRSQSSWPRPSHRPQGQGRIAASLPRGGGLSPERRCSGARRR